MTNRLYFLLLLCIAGLSLPSCLPNSRYNYLIDPTKAKKQNYYLAKADTQVYKFAAPPIQEFIIKPNDWLVINIKSDNYILNTDKDFSATNGTKQITGNQVQGGAAYFLSYLVDSLGNVNLPLIGKVKLQGLNLADAENVVKNEVLKFYKSSEVFVQIKNAQLFFTVVGEVQVQGLYAMPSNNLSILEAVAISGGLTPVANRSYVRLIRLYDNHPKIYTLNLNDLSTLTRPEFFLQPKDVIIVDALPIRQIGLLNPTLKEGASLFFYLTSFLTFFKLI